MGYLKGAGINVLLSISFSFLMTVNVFIFIFIFKTFNLSVEYQLLLENLIKLISAILIYVIVKNLFINNIYFENGILNDKKILIFELFVLIITLLVVYKIQTEIISSYKYCLIFISMMLTGFSEELIYRKLAMKFYPAGFLTIILQSLVFSFIGHGIAIEVINNLIYRFPLGVIFGFIFMKTRRIETVSFLHGMYDLMVYCNLV